MRNLIAAVRERNLGDIYLLMSLVISVFLWLSFFAATPNFTVDSFFVSCLVVANFYFFSQGFGAPSHVQAGSFFPTLFLAQMISLIGMSYSQQVTGGLYLAVIPALCASLFVLDRYHTRKESLVRSALPFFIGIGCYAAFAQNQVYLLGLEEVGVFFAFAAWSMGMLTWATESLRKQHRANLFSLVKKHQRESRQQEEIGDQLRDRYFFHDLINHTHALRLMLTHKISAREGLGITDCESVLQEIKVLQELAQTHFGYKHKDLVGSMEKISFVDVQKGLEKLVNNFLSSERVNMKILYEGDLSLELPESKRREVNINLPLVSRILVNLVKNIAEHKSSQADITFGASLDGLTIRARNKRVSFHNNNDLSRSLEGIILSGEAHWNKDGETGVGLESVGNLCEEAGGDFTFGLEGEYWVSTVFLPYTAARIREKVA